MLKLEWYFCCCRLKNLIQIPVYTCADDNLIYSYIFCCKKDTHNPYALHAWTRHVPPHESCSGWCKDTPGTPKYSLALSS